MTKIDWCCFYYFVRNSLVALLEALCARIFSWDSWRWRANNVCDKLGQNRVSITGMHVWGFNSTVTEHSDYFFWTDTSERAARCCDNTVDKKRVNSCVPKHLFLEGVEQPKRSPKHPGNAFSNALITSRFQDFAAAAWFLKPCFVRFCLIKLITELIRCQRFWEIVFFTGIRVCNFAHPQIEEMQWCLRSLCRYRIWQARQRYINRNPKMYEESCKHFRLCWKPQSICILWSYWIDYSILKVNLKASDAVWSSPALMLVVLLLSNLACVYKSIYVTWCMYSMYIWPYLCESRVCVSACRVMLRCCCWYGFSRYFQ